MNLKRLAIEYIMGLSFFASGVAAVHFQVSKELADFLLSCALNIAGYMLYRYLVKNPPKEDEITK